MSAVSQYTAALFVEKFGSSASVMKPVHFTKNGSEKATYDEAWLQDLIMKYPVLLPADQIERAFVDLIPICTELPSGTGFIDNLLLTPAGDIAIVECKLWRNPEARREVIAQIIQYAKDLAGWSYEEFEQAINRAKPADESGPSKRSLYDRLAQKASIDEARLHDAVSRNLRCGRFLLVIVGDGIREGVEGMTEFLQQHAGLHFTLATVELSILEVPTGGYVVQPRILAKTTNIDRGIVTIQDGRPTIGPPATSGTAGTTTGTRTSITSERFFEELETHCPGTAEPLKAFVASLEEYGVTPEFGVDSIILRWQDETKSWNLGVIRASGLIATDWMSSQVQARGFTEIGEQYLVALAALAPPAFVMRTPKRSGWYVKNFRIDDVLKGEHAQEGWLHAIEQFQAGVTVS
jgi:hypothetical protein